MENGATFGSLIKQKRRALKLTQEEAAQSWGISLAALRAWEQNRNMPTGEDGRRILSLVTDSIPVIERERTMPRAYDLAGLEKLKRESDERFAALLQQEPELAARMESLQLSIGGGKRQKAWQERCQREKAVTDYLSDTVRFLLDKEKAGDLPAGTISPARGFRSLADRLTEVAMREAECTAREGDLEYRERELARRLEGRTRSREV